MLWSDLREEEFNPAMEKAGGVCVVPFGCVEKHGQHLPLGTDTILAERTLKLVDEKEPIVIFPPLYFGDLQGLYQCKGTIALSSELLFSLLNEICDEIGRNGFKKIILYNTHGGNLPLLRQFIRSTLRKKNDYVVYWVESGFPLPKEVLRQYNKGLLEAKLTDEEVSLLEEFSKEGKDFGHACLIETAWMMDLCPELVRTDRADAEDGTSTHRLDGINTGSIFTALSFLGNYPNSYQGTSPRDCTKNLGSAFTEIIVKQAVRDIKAIKADDEALKVNEWINSCH